MVRQTRRKRSLGEHSTVVKSFRLLQVHADFMAGIVNKSDYIGKLIELDRRYNIVIHEKLSPEETRAILRKLNNL